MRGYRTMRDNSDVHALVDGRLYDQRIEALIDHLLSDNWSDPDLETLFNEVVTEFVAPCKVDLRSPDLSSLSLDFYIATPKSHAWPGPFAMMPDATYAAAICFPVYDDEDEEEAETTDMMPGKTLNQAMLLAVVQYAREKSLELYNQTTLRLS